MVLANEVCGFPRKAVFVKSSKMDRGVAVPLLVLWSASEPFKVDEAIAEFGKENVVVFDDIQALESWGDLKARARWALGMGKFQ